MLKTTDLLCPFPVQQWDSRARVCVLGRGGVWYYRCVASNHTVTQITVRLELMPLAVFEPTVPVLSDIWGPCLYAAVCSLTTELTIARARTNGSTVSLVTLRLFSHCPYGDIRGLFKKHPDWRYFCDMNRHHGTRRRENVFWRISNCSHLVPSP